MLKLSVGTNTEKRTTIVEETMTPFQVMTDEGINLQSAIVYMSGAVLDVKDMNKSFADLGLVSSGGERIDGTLFAIVKATSAQ